MMYPVADAHAPKEQPGEHWLRLEARALAVPSARFLESRPDDDARGGGGNVVGGGVIG